MKPTSCFNLNATSPLPLHGCTQFLENCVLQVRKAHNAPLPQRTSLFTYTGLGSVISCNKEMHAGDFTHQESSKPWSAQSYSPRQVNQSTRLDLTYQTASSISQTPAHHTPRPQCAASYTSNGAASTSKTSGNTAATPPRPRAPPASPNAANSPAKPSSPHTRSTPPAPPQTSTATSAANSAVARTIKLRRLNR